MSNNARVFFASESGVRFDTRPAERFGTREYLLDGSVSPFNPQLVLRSLEHALDEAHFNPVRDYIAMTGHYALVAFLIATAFASYEELNLLMFDSVTSEYTVKRVDLREWASEGRSR